MEGNLLFSPSEMARERKSESNFVTIRGRERESWSTNSALGLHPPTPAMLSMSVHLWTRSVTVGKYPPGYFLGIRKNRRRPVLKAPLVFGYSVMALWNDMLGQCMRLKSLANVHGESLNHICHPFCHENLKNSSSSNSEELQWMKMKVKLNYYQTENTGYCLCVTTVN